MTHRGAAFIDVISPCVQFNNHVGSTKSFDYVREHNEAVNRLDVIGQHDPIEIDHAPGTVEIVTQHDGSTLKLRKLAPHYDPSDRGKAMGYLQDRAAVGEIVTGLLYVEPDAKDLHDSLDTVATPLNALDNAALVPGSGALEKLNAGWR